MDLFSGSHIVVAHQMSVEMNFCMYTYVYKPMNEPIPMWNKYNFLHIMGRVDYE